MNDEEITKRLEDLQGQVNQLKSLFDSLKDDVKLLIENSQMAENSKLDYVLHTNNPRFPEIDRYKAFIEKYGIVRIFA
jgi:regulator of replication initiation timing